MGGRRVGAEVGGAAAGLEVPWTKNTRITERPALA